MGLGGSWSVGYQAVFSDHPSAFIPLLPHFPRSPSSAVYSGDFHFISLEVCLKGSRKVRRCQSFVASVLFCLVSIIINVDVACLKAAGFLAALLSYSPGGSVSRGIYAL